jgi:beta-phosphoglucomutase
MNWIQDYQLFLFDFDGLLVDTERLHYASYMEISQRQGCPLNWDFRRFCREAHSKEMGFFDGLVREYPHIFEEGFSKEEFYEEKRQIYIEMLQQTPLKLMDGAEHLLDVLVARELKRAVVTNSPKVQIEMIKKALPVLQKIPLWITREDYSEPKPSPEGYLKAISLLARPGDRIVGFEDTLKGLRALLAAGVDAMLICPADHEHVEEGKQLGAKHFEKLSSINRPLA